MKINNPISGGLGMRKNEIILESSSGSYSVTDHHLKNTDFNKFFRKSFLD